MRRGLNVVLMYVSDVLSESVVNNNNNIMVRVNHTIEENKIKKFDK